MSAFQPRTQVAMKSSPPRPSASSAGISQQSYTRTVTTTAEISRAPRSQPQRKKLVFGWVQDVSGSMTGDRIQASLRGFDHMFEEVYQPTDYLGVVTFSDEMKTLHLPMSVHKIDPSRDKASILNSVDGSTRMYDALGASIQGLQAMARDKQYAAVTHDAVYQLLLITDGGDNCSSEFTLATLTELVAHPGLPNFNLVVVAVSMTARDKQKLRGLCAPEHATLLDVKDISELQHTLRRVGEEVQQRLVVTTTVTQTVVQSQGHRGGGGRGVQAITEGIAATRLSLPAPPQTQTTQAVAVARQIRSVVDGKDVCQHFLAGRCVFGKKCRNLHPISLLC
mmetsp:Transcript_27357/g.46241  ORF Transcript_27357/g.46241 Transcript_27357/m.46241 type:complete len:337 (-) Transcript_27357:148-1158(-)